MARKVLAGFGCLSVLLGCPGPRTLPPQVQPRETEPEKLPIDPHAAEPAIQEGVADAAPADDPGVRQVQGGPATSTKPTAPGALEEIGKLEYHAYAGLAAGLWEGVRQGLITDVEFVVWLSAESNRPIDEAWALLDKARRADFDRADVETYLRMVADFSREASPIIQQRPSGELTEADLMPKLSDVLYGPFMVLRVTERSLRAIFADPAGLKRLNDEKSSKMAAFINNLVEARLPQTAKADKDSKTAFQAGFTVGLATGFVAEQAALGKGLEGLGRLGLKTMGKTVAKTSSLSERVARISSEAKKPGGKSPAQIIGEKAPMSRSIAELGDIGEGAAFVAQKKLGPLDVWDVKNIFRGVPDAIFKDERFLDKYAIPTGGKARIKAQYKDTKIDREFDAVSFEMKYSGRNLDVLPNSGDKGFAQGSREHIAADQLNRFGPAEVEIDRQLSKPGLPAERQAELRRIRTGMQTIKALNPDRILQIFARVTPAESTTKDVLKTFHRYEVFMIFDNEAYNRGIREWGPSVLRDDYTKAGMIPILDTVELPVLKAPVKPAAGKPLWGPDKPLWGPVAAVVIPGSLVFTMGRIDLDPLARGMAPDARLKHEVRVMPAATGGCKNAALAWSSSDPGAVTIGPNGALRSVPGGAGKSAQVTVQAGGRSDCTATVQVRIGSKGYVDLDVE